MSLPCQECASTAFAGGQSIGGTFTASGTEITIDVTASNAVYSRFAWQVGTLVEVIYSGGGTSFPWPLGRVSATTTFSRTVTNSDGTTTTTTYFATVTVALPALPTEGNVYPNSAKVDGITDTGGLVGGEAVSGAGIQAGTAVASVIDQTTLKLSLPAYPPTVPPTIPAPVAAYQALAFTPGTRASSGNCYLSGYVGDTTSAGGFRTCATWEDVTRLFSLMSLAVAIDEEWSQTSTSDTSTSDTKAVTTSAKTVTLQPSPYAEIGTPAAPGYFRVLRCASCCTPNLYAFLLTPPADVDWGIVTLTTHTFDPNHTGTASSSSTTTITDVIGPPGAFTRVTTSSSSSTTTETTGAGTYQTHHSVTTTTTKVDNGNGTTTTTVSIDTEITNSDGTSSSNRTTSSATASGRGTLSETQNTTVNTSVALVGTAYIATIITATSDSATELFYSTTAVVGVTTSSSTTTSSGTTADTSTPQKCLGAAPTYSDHSPICGYLTPVSENYVGFWSAGLVANYVGYPYTEAANTFNAFSKGLTKVTNAYDHTAVASFVVDGPGLIGPLPIDADQGEPVPDGDPDGISGYINTRNNNSLTMSTS